MRVARRTTFIVGVLVAGAVAAAYGLRMAQQSGAQIHCANRLRNIGIALINYESSFRGFPAAHAGGHSWRIRCMPYMWSSPQFDFYDFETPWDSVGNITIHTRPLPNKAGDLIVYGNPYGPPCDHDDPDATSYVLLVGDNAFAAPERERNREEITDGLANTIAVVEIADSSVHWLSPVDLFVDSMSFKVNDGPNSISSHHPTGPAVVFCDGAVYRLSPATPPEIVHALCTINGDENISRQDLLAQGYLVP